MKNASEFLQQIELASHGAPGPMLRALILRVKDTIETGPHEAGVHAEVLLLKLNHLLTQQQARLAQRNSAAYAYLAPHLVLADRPRTPA